MDNKIKPNWIPTSDYYAASQKKIAAKREDKHIKYHQGITEAIAQIDKHNTEDMVLFVAGCLAGLGLIGYGVWLIYNIWMV